MRRPTALAIALGMDRFTVSDVTSVGTLAENTVRDLLRRMLRDGWIEKAGKRVSRILGRRATEYAWTTDGRVAAIGELKGDWPLVEHGSGAIVDRPSATADDVDPDPFRASVALTALMLDALEVGAPGDEPVRLWSRASAELEMLRRHVDARDAEERTAVAALGVRLEAVREDRRLDRIRTQLLTSQVELLRRVSGIHETTTTSTPTPDRLGRGYAIVIDASGRGNRTAARITAALDELSLQCFVLNLAAQSRKGGMRNLLEDLSAFLSTPLSSIARIFILVDRGAASWRKADQVVGWFDEIGNLKTSVRQARAAMEMKAAGAGIAEVALLVGARTASRAHEWLGHGLNKQQALRLLVVGGEDHAGRAGDAARIALNDPLLIYGDPPSEDMFGASLRLLKRWSSKDHATLKGVVVGSFAAGTPFRSPAADYSREPRHRIQYRLSRIDGDDRADEGAWSEAGRGSTPDF